MASIQEASARSNLYTLCQQLYHVGVTADTLDVVQETPELAATLPVIDSSSDVRLLDELQAAHQDLFGFQIFPFESIFLGDERLLGTAYSDALMAIYHRWGYVPTAQGTALDHIAEELGFVAYLCGAEADAEEDGKLALAQQLQQAQYHFLETHLLRWLAPFVIAVQRHRDPLFAEVATITYALVAEHYQALVAQQPVDHEQQPVHVHDERVPTWSLPNPPDLIANPKTSLHDIATFFATPAHSGIYLSRHLVGQLGRQQRLPRGFGSREQMLTNLLRTAAQYERVPALIAAFHDELTAWDTAHRTLAVAYPVFAPFQWPWQQRIAQTMAMLAQMEGLVANEEVVDPNYTSL